MKAGFCAMCRAYRVLIPVFVVATRHTCWVCLKCASKDGLRPVEEGK